MKNFIFIALLSALTVTGIQAQKFPGADKSSHDIAFYRADNQPVVKVVYGRPNKSGREIFGGVVKFGDVWRTGANEATEVTFFRNVKVGGKDVPAGTYTLFSIPQKDKWTIILNKDVNLWGQYQYKAENDLARIEVPAQALDPIQEAFAIMFKKVDDGAHMLMGWDNVMVAVPIQF